MMAKVYAVTEDAFCKFSTVVLPDSDGFYRFENGILCGNEPMRREFRRLDRILQNYLNRISIHKWKSLYVSKWITEFFIPILDLYERLKISNLVSLYEKVAAKFPERLHYQHNSEFFHPKYFEVEKAVKELVELCYPLSSSTSSKSSTANDFNQLIENQCQKLRTTIIDLKTVMEAHYDEEE
jgi:hypothetical protein